MRERILRRLAETQVSPDPARDALGRWTPDLQAVLFPDPLIAAAVLVPVVDTRGELSLLLTERTAHLRDHAGQISFPGGRVEPEDEGPLAAALREAGEEVGLRASVVDIAGYLPPYAVVTGFVVSPVVGLTTGPLSLELDDFEVAEAFEVPLDFFLDSRQRKTRRRLVRETEITTIEYVYQGRRIWGATAHIIDEFVNLLNKK